MAPLGTLASADIGSSEPMQPSDSGSPSTTLPEVGETLESLPARDVCECAEPFCQATHAAGPRRIVITPLQARELLALSAVSYEEPFPLPSARLRLVPGGRTPNAIADDLATARRDRRAVERLQADLLSQAREQDARRIALLEREEVLRLELERLVVRLAEG